MIDNSGINFMSSSLEAKYNYIAIGDNSTPEVITDTELVSELFRELSTNTIYNTNSVNDSVKYYKRFETGSAMVLREFGLFDSSTNGDIFAREVTPNIIVPNGDYLDVQFNVIIKEV